MTYPDYSVVDFECLVWSLPLPNPTASPIAVPPSTTAPAPTHGVRSPSCVVAAASLERR